MAINMRGWGECFGYWDENPIVIDTLRFLCRFKGQLSFERIPGLHLTVLVSCHFHLKVEESLSSKAWR